MSDAKAPKKVETGSKKTEATKPEATKPEATKPEATKPEATKPEATASETTSADNSANKTESKPTSASQASISHFSSVSTPEYRSGWHKIFSGGKDTTKTKKNNGNGGDLPKYFSITDEYIDAELRSILDGVFRRLIKKQGVSLTSIKKSAVIEYSIDCNIREK